MSSQGWIGHSLLGRYKIEEPLGQGGMSAVYKAIDPNLKRTVAVKMIHPHLSSDPEFVRRFETEAAAVAQLRHPNIVKVFDFNHEEDVYFMVLEFIPGETLQKRLRKLNQEGRTMSVEDVVQYGSGIARAADYAHKRGMIHRDIKPANVLINLLGNPILMDFGIARIVGEQHFTATGAVLGTALYMSPEQIRGEHPDHRADIYSLGVMLYEMVCGRPPYESDSAMSVMMMHLHDPLPDLTTINPDTPPALKAVIEKSLAKAPEDRFSSAAELSQALESVLKPSRSPETASVQLPTPPAAPPPAAVDEAETEALDSGVEIPGDALAAGAAVVPDPTLAEPAAGGGATVVEEPAPAPAAVATQVEPAQVAPGNAAPPSSAVPPAAGRGPVPRQGGPNRTLLLAGGGGIILLLVVIFLASQLFGGNSGAVPPEEEIFTATAPQSTEGAAVIPATDTPTPIPPTATETPIPSVTPTITQTPTETVPPGFYVRINDITIEGDRYVVEYETFEYTEALPGMHVHFYYDTVSEANAGAPGSGPWILYGGPRPFTGYTLNSRPAGAIQMCARVANPNHSIIPGSGNCFDLPEN